MVDETANPRAGGDAAQERYGILELLRARKDDGRALILYRHDEPDGDPPPQAPTGERGRA